MGYLKVLRKGAQLLPFKTEVDRLWFGQIDLDGVTGVPGVQPSRFQQFREDTRLSEGVPCVPACDSPGLGECSRGRLKRSTYR